MPWYFIPRVLKLANTCTDYRNVCPEWLRRGLGNCESVGKAHCTGSLNCHGNTLVPYRNVVSHGSAVQSVALPISAMRFRL